MARVDFKNGRHVYVSAIEDGDEAWLQGVNARGRKVLLRRELVRRVVPVA
jgi:hypothetical protein